MKRDAGDVSVQDKGKLLVDRLYDLTRGDNGPSSIFYRIGYTDGVRKSPMYTAQQWNDENSYHVYVMGYEDGMGDAEDS
jgi:hypothetical protein